MKKAKFMLAAIAVLAVVGGALAFKIKDSSAIVYTHSATDPTTLCTVPLTGITNVTNARPTVLSATFNSASSCTVATFYITD